jgi:UDP-N-acetylmuramate dehydrogenase
VSDPITTAETILRAACGDRIRTRFPMAPLTTFRIGGAAAIYLEPESERDLAAVSQALRASGLPVVVLGKGSNVLVSDRGFPGIVLRLGRGYRWVARDGSSITAGGSMPLPALAGVALRHDLSGMEFGVAIPASLGGAVAMNAGAHGRSMSEVVDVVEVFGLRDGGTTSVAGEDAGFAYRRSSLGDDAVVTGATMQLERGDPSEIRRRMDEARVWRRTTQPLAEPNCGSVFTNPPDGHAAELIERAGLKGSSVGGATVSEKHANFIVTTPGASAEDVRALIALVQLEVGSRTGVHLDPEVRMVGEFDDARA